MVILPWWGLVRAIRLHEETFKGCEAYRFFEVGGGVVRIEKLGADGKGEAEIEVFLRHDRVPGKSVNHAGTRGVLAKFAERLFVGADDVENDRLLQTAGELQLTVEIFQLAFSAIGKVLFAKVEPHLSECIGVGGLIGETFPGHFELGRRFLCDKVRVETEAGENSGRKFFFKRLLPLPFFGVDSAKLKGFDVVVCDEILECAQGSREDAVVTEMAMGINSPELVCIFHSEEIKLILWEFGNV